MRGALFRAGTSDPYVVLFVWATRECPSCHQLEKTFIIYVECMPELESLDAVNVSHWIRFFDQHTTERTMAAKSPCV